MGKRQIIPLMQDVYRVISEPGDLTRYEYIVAKQGHGEYTFMPLRNTFNYPQRMSSYDDRSLSDVAAEWNCNPWTVEECRKMVLELEGGCQG